MNTNHKVEETDTIYNYHVSLIISGNPAIEKAIDRYLQETLEKEFLQQGEKVEFCEIISINKKK